ncbi:MAG: hypothetical protein KBC38_01410 [Candidatus Pacebacteria bacterium]|nr:hypothetical protein [Candidatus Paceibacterota bacterium]MBP9840293.1 hypothetical protein [Candidatus Paceibacterota bacterium]
MTHITFASRSAIARFASALTVFALVATPFMTLIPASAHATAPTPASISIDTVEDDNGSYTSPFDFSCPVDGNEGEITIYGSGASASNSPGQIEDYAVAIDWGDGSATTTDLGTFTPPSGTSTFTYEFTASHSYSSYGPKTVTAYLYHGSLNGNDGDAVATITLSPCSTDPGVTTDAADNISHTDATMHGTNGPVAATNSSYWVSLAPIDTGSSSIPPGVYSTPTQGAVAANGALAGTPLSSVATSGIPGNIPGGIQPDTTYYFVAWIEVGGDWYPGEVLSVTTLPDPEVPPACGIMDNTTFDGFSLGSVNGQGGWGITGPYDHAIVDNTYGFPTFGCKTLRISNAVTAGSFGDQIFSYSVANEAGETVAENNGMSGGTRQERFEAEFDIASADADVYQPGLAVTVSPDRGDGARMSYLRFEDSPDGIDVYFYDVQSSTDPANFVQTQIANDLPRTSPHTVKLVMDFVDGPVSPAALPANDVVEVFIDGVSEHIGTSWENYYRYDNESNPGLIDTSRTVDSLLFRVAGTAAPETDEEGFLFDNVSIETGPTPGPVVETSTVTLCKYADTYPEETPLPGWTLTLTGDTVQESFAVPVADPVGVNSNPLVAGVSYVATAMGTWLNDRPDDAPEGNDVDAEYSTIDEWVTQMDGYDGFGTNILELEINETDGEWGTYNSSHTYAQAFTVAADGPANFRIFDGDGAHVQQPSWFADNKDSTLEVEISEGYAGVTGENGCVTFEDVPFGSYEVGEVMQDGWENESGLGEVTVDEEEMVFDVVNHNDDFGNDSCMLVSDTTTLEGGTASDLVPEPHHESWTAVVDMLAMWIWGDEEVTDPTGEETQVFTKTFWLESVPASDATLVIGADNSYEVELNGTPVGNDANEDNYTNAEKDTITIPMADFELGANTLVFTVKNIAFGGGTQETNPAGLIYKLTIPGTECQQTPPDQAELQVHIYKYIQDENDAIALATEGSFPMSATWDAANIGAGSGNYALNAGNSYHAATSPMSQQADYSTYEVTDGNPVMPADSNSCPADKYRLVGYKTGDTLIEAENDAIDDDFPVFDSLDADKYVIVVNEDCDDLDIPPTEQVKVHIYKYLEDENDVATQIPDNAEIAPFAMTATWTADNLNSGTESSGEYVLGNNHGGTSLTYAADTSPMDVGADYTTSEITGENGVLPVGGECVEGAYRLVGYKSGTTLEEAEGGVVTAAAPIFTDLQTDQHVIVVNEDCDDVFDDSTPSEEQFTITSTVEGDGTVTPLGAIVVNEGDNQMFTFTDGGQSLVEVLIDGVDIGSPADYTFSSVNANHTVHARFATNGGGGGGGGGNNNGGQVLGASTDDMCIPLLHTYMRMGIVNDAQEVMDLKGFLNEEMGLTLPIDSNFDAATDAAVRAFQTKYKTEVLDPWTPFGFNDQPTGYVFKLTQWKVNSIHCAPTIYPFPALP